MELGPKEKDIEISCTDKIEEFKKYMDNNPRSILSSGFGNGKSYFLRKFMKSTGDEYIYIPIYPVNYQVADNKDIFEYIKRDILVELLSCSEERIYNGENFNKLLLLQFYLMNKPGEAIENFAEILPQINIGYKGICSLAINPGKVAKSIRKLHDDYKEYAEKFKKNEKKLDDFISSFNDERGGIYEFDPISQLICEIIDGLRKEHNKKIVLIIEDLDRIDPAHLFRILNIFSAHFDGSFSKEEGSNKFRFDKVLLVCDYDNIEKIYRHFYGSETCFKGYISKFSVTQPYRYSLRNEYVNYVVSLLDPDISKFALLSTVVAELIIANKGVSESSLREIRNKVDQEYFIKDRKIELSDGYFISSKNPLSKLLDILRRFDCSFEDLYKQKSALIDKNNIGKYKFELMDMVGVCWFMLELEQIKDRIALRYNGTNEVIVSIRDIDRFKPQYRMTWKIECFDGHIKTANVGSNMAHIDNEIEELYRTIPSIAQYLKQELMNNYK